MTDQQLQESLSIIKDSGLPHQIAEREFTDERTWTEEGIERKYSREHIEVLVARTEKELAEISEALKSGSPELIGQAYGYPEGSIPVFEGKRPQLDIQSLPPEIRTSDAIIFSSPTLSADGWQGEIKLGQQYADFLKKVSPQVYQEYRKTMIESLHRE